MVSFKWGLSLEGMVINHLRVMGWSSKYLLPMTGEMFRLVRIGSSQYLPNYRVLKGGCPRGGGNWGTVRIPREDWGTLGNIRED